MAKLWVAFPVPQPTHILTCAPPVNCLTKTVWFAQRCFSWFRKLDSNAWTFNYIILDTCDDLNENNAMNQPWILAKLSHSKTECLENYIFIFKKSSFYLSVFFCPSPDGQCKPLLEKQSYGITEQKHITTQTLVEPYTCFFLFYIYIYMYNNLTHLKMQETEKVLILQKILGWIHIEAVKETWVFIKQLYLSPFLNINPLIKLNHEKY